MASAFPQGTFPSLGINFEENSVIFAPKLNAFLFSFAEKKEPLYKSL